MKQIPFRRVAASLAALVSVPAMGAPPIPPVPSADVICSSAPSQSEIVARIVDGFRGANMGAMAIMSSGG